MILSRKELADSFQVSANTISTWRAKGLPCRADGGPGVKAQYDFEQVARFLWRYSLFGFANYEEPDIVIADARRRARGIILARSKRVSAS